MKYILFANNRSCNPDVIDQLTVCQDDICVFFNRLVPFTIWPNLKNQNCKKYYFARYRDQANIPIPEVYAGLNEFMPIKNIFDKLYLYRMPKTLKDKEVANRCQLCIEHHKLNDINSIYNLSALKKKYGVNIDKSLSSGLLMYLHILDIKKSDDEIYLIGFTSSLSSTYHDSDQEKKFFAQELQQKQYVKIYT